MSTEPGQVKNLVDLIRRAAQLPVSQLAGGQGVTGPTLTVSLQPNSFQAAGGVANSYQSTVDVASQGGWSGVVTLTETNTLTAAGGSVGLPTTSVNVAPSSDGLAVLNVTVAASTAQGTYTVTVTGTSGALTASAVLTVIVGQGAAPCLNNSDCGSGSVCVNGKCYSPIDMTLLGCGPNAANGTGPNPCNTAKWTSICSGMNQGAPVTINGCCYCGPSKPTDCAQYTSQCQAKKGPCSVSQYVCSPAGCGCFCSQCTNWANPIAVTCPSNVTACVDKTTPIAQNVVSQFTVMNTDTSPLGSYNVQMSLTPVGTNCACCGLGPSLSSSAFGIGPGASQQVIITVPLTCTTPQCYSWNLKITVSLPVPQNTAIQTFTCPFQICTTTSACFVLEAQCNPLTGFAVCGSSSWTANASGTGLTESGDGRCACPNPDPAHCSNVAIPPSCSYAVRLRSVNGFAGTVTLTSTCAKTDCAGYSNCNPPCGLPTSQAITANATVALGTFCVPTVCAPLLAYPPAGQTAHAPSVGTVTGTSSTLKSVLVITNTEYYLAC